MIKTCQGCGKEKDETLFHGWRSNPDTNICKECQSKKRRKWNGGSQKRLFYKFGHESHTLWR